MVSALTVSVPPKEAVVTPAIVILLTPKADVISTPLAMVALNDCLPAPKVRSQHAPTTGGLSPIAGTTPRISSVFVPPALI